MQVAIYTRKSIYTDNSESIHAQISMCEDYCKNNFKNYTVVKFNDEGYTGANIKRPAFKQLLEQIELNTIDIVVCYRIDRISRSVLDFSNFFNLIEEKGIKFVSVTEKIDTTTPSGRAMMYMSSVFGQMERESIAERVKDTMLDMAKNGYWCGGRAPLGYKIANVTIDNKTHKALEFDPKTLFFYKRLVKLFVDENLSLNGVLTRLKHDGILRTPLGGRISTTVIWQILSNPVYAQADEVTYNYFKSKGCNMIADKNKFDGTKALIRYGRTVGSRGKKHQVKKIEDWNISVGLHGYVITSDVYMQIMSKFGVNKINKERKHEIGIVHGILRCKCGSVMRAKVKYDKKYSVSYKHYICRKRYAYGKEACDMPYQNLELIDKAIIDILKNISLDKDLIDAYEEKPSTFVANESELKKEILTTKTKIENLTKNLALSSKASKYLIEEIERLDTQLNNLNLELSKVEQNKALVNINAIKKEEKYNQICELLENLEELEYKDLQDMLRKLLKECWFDGENLHIKI